ncbi:MAG: YqgE/AlgH family protein [Gammaproteobacteria bacterium]|nr:YqgE/AlgH family protein [Gammaproteobacteria bacterium]
MSEDPSNNSLHNFMLISMPQMEDENFTRSLVYICEHSNKGAMGLVINRTNNIAFTDILPQLDITDSHITNIEQPIFTGGPVQPEHGFVLHTPHSKKQWKSSIRVSEDLCLTTSSDVIDDIAHATGPKHSLIALGYAGWGPGQLEQELVDNAWLCCPFDADIVFNMPAEDRFQAAADLLGIDINLISSKIGHG